jgi:transposase-like protein
MDRASLERLLGQGLSLAEIGRRFGLHESTVGYWVKKHGLKAVHRDRHVAKGGLQRVDLEQLTESGATLAEIAGKLGCSKATVRHWLMRYGLRTGNARGRRASECARAAKEAGRVVVRMACVRHGETQFVLDSRGYYRCRRCRAAAVARRRQKVKAILVQEAGGCCGLCGYRRSMRALHFHHVDPIEKRIEINAKGIALSLQTLRNEAKKCVLLCSNCHAEIEDGTVSLPADALHRYSADSTIDPG